MNAEGDMSGGFNQFSGGIPYQFMNQAAVNIAVASGQNIDWAELAQKWIQMRDAASPAAPESKNTNVSLNPTASDKGSYVDKILTGGYTYEEKGEADMDMDDEDHLDDAKSGGYDKSRRDTSSAILQQHAANKPWFMDRNAGEPESGINPQRNQWWQNNKNVSQSNMMNRQANPTAHIPSLLKINVPHPNEIRSLPDEPSEPNLMDAAKRKGLPAWIREGLEKMEREKLKQEKPTSKDQLIDIYDANDGPMSSKKAMVNSFNLNQLENEHEDSSDGELPVRDRTAIDESNVTNVDISDEEVESLEKVGKSYEQRLADMMIVVRQTLTELLLEVTNEEIFKIANETVKSHKLKASSAQVVHNSALSSITGKLGLAAYGDSSSDEYSDDDDVAKKNFHSDSGNDSEEELRNTVRMKKRSFAKIANDIEDRVTAAAAREEEKLKFYMHKEDTEIATKVADKRDMLTNETASLQSSSSSSEYKNIGKNYERDSGEKTDSKLQLINGKRQKDRGAPKERTTRFSDNRDSKYLAISATASYIAEAHAKAQVGSAPIATNQNQTAYNLNSLMPNYSGITSTLTSATTTADMELVAKHKTTASPDHRTNKRSDRSDKEYKYDKRKRQRRGNSKSSSKRSSSTSSSSSSTSSSSTSSESTTSGSSADSKYSRRSASKHSSEMSKKSSHSKYDDRKYYSSSSYDKKRRGRDSSSRYRRDKSRSRSSRRHGSNDSDDEYSSRHSSSHYSSSHSRRHNSSRSNRDYSRSHSRSSYSSSSKRRH